MQRGCSLVFSSVPTLAFLFPLMLVWAAISYQLQKPIHRIWMNIIHSSMQWLPEIWQLMGLMGGGLFVNFKLYSFNVKCSQKRVNLGTPFLFTILIRKLLTYFFSEGIRWHSLLFSSSPCFFLGCFFGLPSVISCRNAYIEYRCTWCICRYNDCPKFGNSWGDPFVQVKLPSFMSHVVKTRSIWETHFLPQSWSKTYPKPQKCPICWVSHMFSIWEHCYSYGIALALFMHSKILP